MFRRFLVVPVAVLAVTGLWLGASLCVDVGEATAQVAQTESVAGDMGIAAAPQNLWVREPIVVMDVTGSTLLGPLHSTLLVYNDGAASISSASDNVVFGGGESSADFTFVGTEVANALRKALAKAGAGQLLDQELIVSDVPLTTVTFFAKPGPKSRANTFSYWIGFTGHAEVAQVLGDFVAAHFPSLSGTASR